MDIKSVYINPLSINAFQHPFKIQGLITGVKIINTNNKDRLCYEVDYLDKTDYVPISDIEEGIYELVDKEEIPFHERIYSYFFDLRTAVNNVINKEIEDNLPIIADNNISTRFNIENDVRKKTLKKYSNEEVDLYNGIGFFDYIGKYGIDSLE